MSERSYQRKSPRLKGYDYTQNGAYFVTICTHEREYLFGDVVDGEMQLNAVGHIAAACWEAIATHYRQVELDVFCVMPNHVHGVILIVDSPPSRNVGTSGTGGTRYISSLQPSPKKVSEKSTQPPSNTRLGAAKGSLGAIVGTYKAAVTREANRILNIDGGRFWQPRYHDHIIRSQTALDKIREYTLSNATRWHEDSFYQSEMPPKP